MDTMLSARQRGTILASIEFFGDFMTRMAADGIRPESALAPAAHSWLQACSGVQPTWREPFRVTLLRLPKCLRVLPPKGFHPVSLATRTTPAVMLFSLLKTSFFSFRYLAYVDICRYLTPVVVNQAPDMRAKLRQAMRRYAIKTYYRLRASFL